MTAYGSAWPLVRGASHAFRPPRRVPVADGAARSLRISQTGGYTGHWDASETPYMVEPMNRLASRVHEAVCFTGPARSGKTMGLLDGWFTYAVTCDPGDMLFVQMTQEKARDYSKMRIERAIRHSPDIAALMSRRGHDDNTHDKLFQHGMWLKIGWPSATQLASSDYRYVALTDYDRMPDNVDGEGSPYGLALKRTTTYLSRGMCLVESSPARPVTDPHWQPATAHEAPPVGGITGIYNRGDRHRWYWQCCDCREWFEAAPGLGLFATLPPEEDLINIVRTADLDALAAEHANVVCPHCGSVHTPDRKHTMNANGVWLADGETIDADGNRGGAPMKSSIASYWLGGVAATYQPWRSLVLRYLHALRDYALTGSEFALQNTVNTDQGMPYMSRALLAEYGQDGPGDYAEPLDRFVVPEEARFVTAAVDVQGGKDRRFVVQAHAHGPHGEEWIIDRYSITESNRKDESGVALRIDPASHPEDWAALTERVEATTYRTTTDGQELRVKMWAVDSGGEEGVTENAYAWYRELRRLGLSSRVMLIKGASTAAAPLLKESKVGGKDRKTGDIPLYTINPNALKDAVANSWRREGAGPGKLHLPNWLGGWFWDELQAETRGPDGRWKKIGARRSNEALDLCVYNRIARTKLGADRMNWDAPLPWARPVESNSERVTREDRRDKQSEQARQRKVRKGRSFS